MRTTLLLICISTAGATAGCGRYAVRPDEKEFLADRIMQPDHDTFESSSDDHVLTNREAAFGGAGAGGGGCGCN